MAAAVVVDMVMMTSMATAIAMVMATSISSSGVNACCLNAGWQACNSNEGDSNGGGNNVGNGNGNGGDR